MKQVKLKSFDDYVINEYSNYVKENIFITNETLDSLNESIGGTLLTMIKSTKSASTIRSKYKKLKQSEYASKLESEKEQLDMDEDSEEKKDEYIAKAKEKLNDAIAKKTANLTGPQKQEAGTKLRASRDEQLNTLEKTFGERYKTQKEIVKKKANAETSKITDAIKELGELKIESPFVKNQIDEFKAQVDLDTEIEYMNNSTELAASYAEDPDMISKIEAKAAAAANKLKKEKQADLAKMKQETEESKRKIDEDFEKAAGDEKEGLEKIKAFYDALNSYQTAGNAYISDPDNEDNSDAVADAREALTKAQEALGKKALIGAKLATDADWEEKQRDISSVADAVKAEYKEELAGIAKKKKPTPSKSEDTDD